jgi:iron complex outermembrane receptor protein
VNTTNQGLDVVLAYNKRLGKGKLTTSIAANFNKLTVDKVNTTDKLKSKQDVYFSKREKAFLVASAPNSKLNFSATYDIKNFTGTFRLVRYGEVTLLGYDDAVQLYKAQFVTDIALGYAINKHFNINAGVDNLLNVYPTLQDIENTESGGAWDPVQMNYNGRRYFVRLGFKF